MSLNSGLISSEFKFNVSSSSDRVVYVFDEYRLDKSRRMLYRGALELNLPPKAVETLIALIEMRGEIVGKDDLMRLIWADTIVEESNLAHHLHVLRKTLGQRNNGHTFIETLRGRGYRFNSEVQVVKEADAPKRNGQKAASELGISRFADQQPPNGLSTYSTESTAAPVQIPDRVRYWPLVAALGTLVVLIVSATFLYFQLKRIPAARRGEISVTPLTNGNAVFDAAISQDGKYFVYHEADQDKVHLWLQQTGKTGRIEIIPPGERIINGKTFSPNGEFVYFVGQEKGEVNYSLYRVSTFGGPMTKILADIASPVSFSPDGSEMAFARYNDKTKESQLVVAAADGGRERILVTRPGVGALSTGNTWSPDGKFIAFGAIDLAARRNEGTCSIAAVEVGTGTVNGLSPERWDGCYRMAWTPDGAGVVFLGTRAAESYTTRRGQVYYLSVAEARSRRLSTDGTGYQDTSLGITADNSILAVPTKKLSQIWVMNANGDVRTAVQLTNGHGDGRAGIAPLPDGRIGYLSRVGENLSIWIMDQDGSNQRQISDHFPFVEELRATPDGRFFIFSAPRDGFNHLYRIDTDGQNLKQLTAGETVEVDSTISPDSRWVYYGSGVFDGHSWKTHLRKTAIDDAQTIELKELETAGLVPHISPDGKLIAGVTYGGLKIFSSSDGAVVDSLETDKWAVLSTGARWTPDGKSLTYLVYRENSVNVWTQPLSRQAVPRSLTHFSKGYIYFHAFSHDGSKLYIARGSLIRDPVLIKNF